MKKLAILLFIWIPSLLFAQSNMRESVFTHLSSSELLVGETLHFKNYVYSEQTGKLSKLSRILYIEILNASGSPVYQTKLTITEGQCLGSFFIPTDLETGSYRFVAYTRWMKNFNQFFHESLTIINPYIHQYFLPPPELEMNVQITVEGEKLLADAKNKVVLRVADQFQRGLETKGKIISNKKKEPIEVIIDEFGFFSFYITPKPDETYQLILEKDQGFQFVDLPRPCESCTQFRVIQSADLFVIKTRTSDPEQLDQVQIEVFQNQERVFSSPIVLNTAFSILKSDLPKGLLRVVFTDDEGKAKARLIWNGAASNHQVRSIGTYASNEKIDIELPEMFAGDLSISIEETESNGEILGLLWHSALNSKIDQSFPHAFYQSATMEQLDNMLLSSKYTGGAENPKAVKLLPEYRSGIVQGLVMNDHGEPMANIPVGLAFSGARRQLTATHTDSLGSFALGYDSKVSYGEPVIDVLSEMPDARITIEPEFYASYPKIISPPVVLDSAKVAAIVKRSINNQIMNAYYVHEKENESEKHLEQFDQVKTYKLEDFTRFSTMRDIFIELIVEVGVSKNEDNYNFKMRSQDLVNGFYEEYPTLLLLDGAFVSSEDLMNISPYIVDRINVVNRKYYFGKSIFDGILSVHTVAKDRAELEPKGKVVDLVPVQQEREAKVVQVIPDSKSKIPAYQDLLYWNPKVKHEGGSLKFNFMTSEVLGHFEIRVEGISQEGEAISQRTYFTVD